MVFHEIQFSVIGIVEVMASSHKYLSVMLSFSMEEGGQGALESASAVSNDFPGT